MNFKVSLFASFRLSNRISGTTHHIQYQSNFKAALT